jgi:membrane protease YdiL (CAAX protease family)
VAQPKRVKKHSTPVRSSVSVSEAAGVVALPAPKTWGARLHELDPRVFFLQTWRELDAEAAEERALRAARGEGYDFRPLVALALGAVCLALMEYFGHSNHFRELLLVLDPEPMRVQDTFWSWLRHSQWLELGEFVWWSGWRVLGYFVIPMLVVKLFWRERLRDHGLETKGFWEHAWIYGLAYCVVLLCVLGVTIWVPHFSEYYPFYGFASRSWGDFWMWEVLYAAQFFSLEFFFRGFWLKALKRSMGSMAIFAMTVPYCMIHFGKPFLETIAAIIAGIFLGTLSMKTRSIWSGFLIHVSVAITMDLAALIASGRGLPEQWWPG